ncbi:hypothetical protein [Paenibacillus sp. JJ1683]
MKNMMVKPFIVGCAFLLFATTGIAQVGAQEYVDQDINNNTVSNQLSNAQVQKKLTENIDSVEKYMESQGTSVLKELEKEKARLESLLDKETSPEGKVQLTDLIQSYTKNIAEYENYLSQGNKSEGEFSKSGVQDPVLSPAVSTVIAYFNVRQYYLAAELLTYAKDRSTGGQYTPYFAGQTYGTSEYARLRNKVQVSGPSGSGSATFSKGSTTKDDDLYYALHKYNYSWKNGSITITDRYDYDVNPEYNGIAGTAVNTMYLAQTLGVIVPYTVVMRF